MALAWHGSHASAADTSRLACCIRCRHHGPSAKPRERHGAMMIDEQQERRPARQETEAVVVDPARIGRNLRKKPRIIGEDKVAVVFGCWTSGRANRCCRCSKRITACCSIRCSTKRRVVEECDLHRRCAQSAGDSGVDYLMKEVGVKRWILEARYVYPLNHQQILQAYLKMKGVKDEDILINYTPFGSPIGPARSPRSRNSAPPQEDRHGIYD